MLDAFADALLSVIYPQQCRICRNSVENRFDGSVCRACWEGTRIFTGTEALCGKCGAFFAEMGGDVPHCGNCEGHNYDAAVAVGIYEKALAASILLMKSEPHLPPRLSGLLSETVSNPRTKGHTLVIPVPLSRKRLRERGFNQAALLARVVARTSNIQIDEASLIRTVHTPKHRVAMDQKARERTVKNAFEVVRPKLIEGQSVLLVDDVFTSGATASNCAKVLKENGASRVVVLTLARAVSRMY